VANTKPLVAVAQFCEKTLEEKDGVLTLVRLIDTLWVHPLPPTLTASETTALVAETTLVITLRSGSISGPQHIDLIGRSPSGRGTIKRGFDFDLLGESHGQTVIFRIGMAVNEMGLFWFDVVWNNEVLTSVPLRLAPIQQRPADAAQSQT